MVDAARIGGSIPCYQHCLSLLGEYLNQQHGSRATIAEMATGFLVIYFKDNRWTNPITVTVNHVDLLELQGSFEGTTANRSGFLLRDGGRRDRKHAACPMGFDVFLRALGIRLQRRGAVGVTICDAGKLIYVGYWVDRASFVIREGHRRAVSSLQLETYDAAAVHELLRGTAASQSEEMTRYKGGLQLNPHDHISMLDAATVFEIDGKYREAETLLAQIVAAVPGHPEAYYHIGRLALVRGDRHAALTAAKKAVALRPDDPAVVNLLGRVLHHSNKNKDAVPMLQRAIALDPDNGLQHHHLAKVYEALGQQAEAEAEMALSTVQLAAPAWDMVQENIEEIEIHPQTASRQVERLPAESALLPPAADEAVVPEPMAVPTLTTTFEPGLSAWPPEAITKDQPDPWSSTEASMPRMTPFPDTVVPPPAPVTQEQSPAASLEQRMRQAREAPFRGAPQVSRPASQGLSRRPITQSLNTPPVELDLGDMPALGTPEPPAPPVTRLEPPAPPVTRLEPPASPVTRTEPREPRAQRLSWSVPFRTEWRSPGEEDAAPTAPVTPVRREAATESAAKERQDRPASRDDVPTRSATQRADPAVDSSVPAAVPPVVAGRESRPAPEQPVRTEEQNAANVELAAEILAMQRAVAADPGRADLHRKLGFLLARQGKPGEAADEFRKALQASRTTL